MDRHFRRLQCVLLFLMALGAGRGAVQAQNPWIQKYRTGDEVRFLFTGRVERYNMATHQWLAGVSLPRTGATAFAGDGEINYVAFGRNVFSYSASFTAESLVATLPAVVTTLRMDGNLLVAVHGRVSVINRTTRAILGTNPTSSMQISRGIVLPGSNRVLGAQANASEIITVTYTDAGTVASAVYPDFVAGLPSTALLADPDERLVIAGGAVFAASGDSGGAIGPGFIDVAWNGDVPVGLTGSQVIGYDSLWRTCGTQAVSFAQGIEVTATDAVLFTESAGSGSVRPTVARLPLESLNVPDPGTPATPAGRSFTPEFTFADQHGTVWLYDTALFLFHRWNSADGTWLRPVPLSERARTVSWSAAHQCLYLLDYGGALMRLDTDQPAATPSLIVPRDADIIVHDIIATDFGVLRMASNGLFHFDRNGNLLASRAVSTTSRMSVYSSARRGVFTVSGSPSQLVFVPFNADGTFGQTISVNISGDVPTGRPLAISPDGEAILMATGVMLKTSDGTMSFRLADPVVAATIAGGSLYTARSVNFFAQIQMRPQSGGMAAASAIQLPGTARHLLETPEGMVLVSQRDQQITLTLSDRNLRPLRRSSERLAAPGPPMVTSRGVDTVSLRWTAAGGQEFRVQTRTAGGTGAWTTALTTREPAATVSGLAPATAYEFRIFAIGDPDSNPSRLARATTLTQPEQPPGEPYDLTAVTVLTNRITLRWNDLADNETGFRILRSATAGGAVTTFTLPAGTRSWDDVGLTANTLYFYRIQAFNGQVDGELSAQISVRTAQSTAVPAAPINVFTLTTSTEATVRWTPVGQLAVEYAVEQLIGSTWVTVAVVPAIQTSALITGLAPGSFQNFRVSARNPAGTRASSDSFTQMKPSGFGTTGVFDSIHPEYGGIRYFTFTDPPSIRRFRLGDRTWLPEIPTPRAITSVWADADGIYALTSPPQTSSAEPQLLLRWNADGTQPVILGPASGEAIVTVGNVLAVMSRQRCHTYDKRTGTALVDNEDFYLDVIASLTGAPTLAPVRNRIVFVSNPFSALRVGYADIDAAGRVVRTDYVQDSALAPNAGGIHALPDGHLFATSDGRLFLTEDMTPVGSLGAPVNDMKFVNDELPVVLTGTSVRAFSRSFVPSAPVPVASSGGLGLGVSGPDAVVFFRDPASATGIRMEYIPLSLLDLAPPGQQPDPSRLDFPVDDLILGGDGIAYVLSRRHRTIFPWSPALRRWLPNIPLAGGPFDIDWDPQRGRLVTAYPQGRIGIIDPAAPVPAETFVPGSRSFLAALEPVGSAYYMVGEGGTQTISGDDGSRISTLSVAGMPRGNAFDAAGGRLYHTGSSIGYHRVSPTGVLSDGPNTFGSGVPFAAQIRLRGDGGLIALSTGEVFNTSLVRMDAPPGVSVDAAWLDDQLVRAAAEGTGFTRLTKWSLPAVRDGEVLLDGSPLRVFSQADGTILAATRTANGPVFHVLDRNLDPLFTSSTAGPGIVTALQPYRVGFRETIRLAAAVTASPGLAIQWHFNGSPIPGATGQMLEIPSAGSLDAGAYSFTATSASGSTSSNPVMIFVGPAAELFTVGNLLVGYGDRIIDYSPEGGPVKELRLPPPAGGASSGELLGLAIDGRGLVHVARQGWSPDRTTHPFLHSFDPGLNTWSTLQMGGPIASSASFPIDAREDFVVTPRGIFYPPAAGPVVLPAGPGGFTPSTFAISEDGLIAAAESGGRFSTYDRAAPGWATVVNLQGLASVRRIAWTPDDGIIASGNLELRRFAQDGTLLRQASLPASFGSAVDLDVGAAGRIAAGSRSGQVLIADQTTLAPIRTITLGSPANTIVSWVPEPQRLNLALGPEGPPQAMEDADFSWVIPATHTDPDATLTFSAERLPAWLKLEGGRLTGRPLQADTGIFTFTVSTQGPGSTAATRTYTAEAVAVNDAPQGRTLELTVLEDAPALELPLADLVTDEESAVLTYSLAPSAGGPAAAALSGDRLRITMLPDLNGSAVIRVRGADPEGLSGEAIILLTVTPVNDAPRLPSGIPDLSAGPAAPDAAIDLAAFARDPDDGDALRWAILTNSNPAIFSSLAIDSTGRLQISYAPYRSGSADITVRATDLAGESVDATFRVELPDLPAPAITILAGPTLNRQTGLFEQRIAVTNVAQRALGGFEIAVAGLRPDMCLYNASDCRTALPLVGQYRPLPAGASTELVMEYYSPSRVRPAPQLSAATALPQEPSVSASQGVAVDRILPIAKGALLVEFLSVPGALYKVQYSHDAAVWHDSLIRIRAAGTRTQWIDQGQPRTPSPPMEGASRFYRIQRLTAE